MKILKECWLASYSPDQGCFNVETAEETAENIIRQTLGGWSNHYITFAACASSADASAACDELHAAMVKKGAKTCWDGMVIKMLGRKETTPEPH